MSLSSADTPLHLQLGASLKALAADFYGTRAPRWGVALSGGGDSLALLLLLLDLGEEVVALHLDHALRPESAAEARWVQQTAERFGVPFRMRRIEVRAAATKGNLAAKARDIRFAALHQLAREASADAVLMAHTQDDQAETVLLQLLRGAHALVGMPERRGRVLRPLLGIRREALREALRDRGETWLEDPSNADPDSRRIWIRSELLPRLEAQAPGVCGRLAQLASLQRTSATFIQGEVDRRIGSLKVGEGVAGRQLAQQPVALQRAALARMLRVAGAEVDFARIEAARSQLGDPNPRAPWSASLGRNLAWRLAGDELRVTNEHPSSPEPPLRARTITRPDELPVGVPASLLAAGSLELRPRQSGDYVRFDFGRRPLSRVLIDAKVPRELRQQLLLARGAEVVYVPGVLNSDGGVARLLGDEDEQWMLQALSQARLAGAAGELPVGALLVRDGQLLGVAHNETRKGVDPTAHAEVLALRRAAAALGDWRLEGATLYVTLEPCPMCFGAMQSAHVSRVVFGAENLREGSLGGVASLHLEPWKRRLEVRGGVAAKEAGKLLRAFFERRRSGHVG